MAFNSINQPTHMAVDKITYCEMVEDLQSRWPSFMARPTSLTQYRVRW